MIFKPYHYFETGCAAYLFGCGGLGLCAVVDAREQDIDGYIGFAASKGMRISHVIDTHVHADHRSGGPALANKAGAAYCLHESASVALPFEPLRHGQEIALGNTKRCNPLLSKSRDEFVKALSDVPPKPEAMEQILWANQGRHVAER